MNYRIFVEKLPAFQTEACNLKDEFNRCLMLNIKQLRLINVYDIFGFTEELCQKSLYRVFGEVVTDKIDAHSLTSQENREQSGNLPFPCGLEVGLGSYFAVEYLPGQFDQRAAAAEDCVRLIDPDANITIKSARLLIFAQDIQPNDLQRIKQYLINPVEMREKDMLQN
jgi:phosphoribosylformylglycinamidine synthase